MLQNNISYGTTLGGLTPPWHIKQARKRDKKKGLGVFLFQGMSWHPW